jgi:hypothetical protein
MENCIGVVDYDCEAIFGVRRLDCALVYDEVVFFLFSASAREI